MRFVKFESWTGAVATLALLALAGVGCASSSSQPAPAPQSDPDVVLRVSGSGTTTAILQALEAKFEADTPGYRLVLLAGTGTGGGVRGVVEGLLDIAAMARPPKDEEAASGVSYVELGKSAATVYSHPSVGISGLTSEQIATIFSGEITNWSQVGGQDRQIIMYVRDEEESSTKALRSSILGDAPFSSATAQILTSQTDMMNAVAGTPDSVGFGSWPAALASGANLSAIEVDGIPPSAADYPSVTPVGVGYLSERAAEIQPFIDWVRSERGQAALRGTGVLVTE